jgi:hypothetical protein
MFHDPEFTMTTVSLSSPVENKEARGFSYAS